MRRRAPDKLHVALKRCVVGTRRAQIPSDGKSRVNVHFTHDALAFCDSNHAK